MLKLRDKLKNKKGYSLIEIIISLSIISILLSPILLLKQYNTVQSINNDKYMEAINKFNIVAKYLENNCSYEDFSKFEKMKNYYLELSFVSIDHIKNNALLSLIKENTNNDNKDKLIVVIEENQVLKINLTIYISMGKGYKEVRKKIFIGKYK